jgi:hypothetical protein
LWLGILFFTNIKESGRFSKEFDTYNPYDLQLFVLPEIYEMTRSQLFVLSEMYEMMRSQFFVLSEHPKRQEVNLKDFRTCTKSTFEEGR